MRENILTFGHHLNQFRNCKRQVKVPDHDDCRVGSAIEDSSVYERIPSAYSTQEIALLSIQLANVRH